MRIVTGVEYRRRFGGRPDKKTDTKNAPSRAWHYWLYYPNSATLRHVPVAGIRGFHRDDGESFQVRVGRFPIILELAIT
jgi:hypothetical protein